MLERITDPEERLRAIENMAERDIALEILRLSTSFDDERTAKACQAVVAMKIATRLQEAGACLRWTAVGLAFVQALAAGAYLWALLHN